jgi:hypothetical protein
LMPCYYIRHNGIYMLVLIGIERYKNPIFPVTPIWSTETIISQS